jgi:hypothetical protein
VKCLSRSNCLRLQTMIGSVMLQNTARFTSCFSREYQAVDESCRYELLNRDTAAYQGVSEPSKLETQYDSAGSPDIARLPRQARGESIGTAAQLDQRLPAVKLNCSISRTTPSVVRPITATSMAARNS